MSKDALLRKIEILRVEIQSLENAINDKDLEIQHYDKQIADLHEKLAWQQKLVQPAKTEFQQKHGQPGAWWLFRKLRGKSKSGLEDNAQKAIGQIDSTASLMKVAALKIEINGFTEIRKTIEEPRASLIQQLAKKQKQLKEAEMEFKAAA